MTTMGREEVRCLVCDAENEFPVVKEAGEQGSPDLDTRPPPEMRATLEYWVQECPSCGYCAPAIEHGSPKAARIVKTEAYKALLANDRMPKLARRFQRASAVLEHSGPVADAGWQSVYAAWACDDANANDAAMQCRERAIELFDLAIAAGFPIADEGGDDEAIVIDLLRRAERFDDAIARCEKALSSKRPPAVISIIAFEEVLARRGDAAVHTFEEARTWRAQPD